MLEAFFQKESRIRKIHMGPLGNQIDELAVLLKERGYSRLAAQEILLTAGELNNYLYARDLSTEDISPELIENFKVERMRLVKNRGIPNHITHILKFLKERNILQKTLWEAPQQNPLSPLDIFLNKYIAFMRNVRGCSESYLSDAKNAVKEFLSRKFSPFSEQSLSNINGKMIMEYFANNASINMHKVGHIRVFCQYLHGQGYCQVIPNVIFPSRKRYKLESPPKSISADSVQKILASCDRNYPDGMRDYAALMTLATLGLRVQEVANLCISDIDWRSAKIKIRKTKVGRERVLSLPNQVGQALTDYVLYGRPNSNLPQVFLRHRAPGGIFTAKSLHNIVSRLAKRAGVQLPTGGRNVFRHSLATAMVNRGVSIKTISDFLDHRSIDTTAIYTMVDFSSMKNVILPLPGGEK